MPELLPGLRPWALIYLPADVRSSAMKPAESAKAKSTEPGNKKSNQTGQQTQQGNKLDQGGYSSPGRGPGSGQSARADKK